MPTPLQRLVSAIDLKHCVAVAVLVTLLQLNGKNDGSLIVSRAYHLTLRIEVECRRPIYSFI